jgi:hypothetical protein
MNCSNRKGGRVGFEPEAFAGVRARSRNPGATRTTVIMAERVGFEAYQPKKFPLILVELNPLRCQQRKRRRGSKLRFPINDGKSATRILLRCLREDFRSPPAVGPRYSRTLGIAKALGFRPGHGQNRFYDDIEWRTSSRYSQGWSKSDPSRARSRFLNSGNENRAPGGIVLIIR